jgi:hypothetical protein
MESSSKRELFIEDKGSKAGYLRDWLPDDQENTHMILRIKSFIVKKAIWHLFLLKFG